MNFNQFTMGFLREEEGGEAGGGGATSVLDGGGAPPADTGDQGGGDFSYSGLVDDKGAFSTDWHKTIPIDGIDDAQRARLSKYSDLPTALKSLAHQESMLGKKVDGVLPPTDGSAPEDIAQFRKAIGAPETVDGYSVAAPENLPEGVTWDESVVKRFAPILDKFHAPSGMMEALTSEFLTMQGENYQAAVGHQASTQASTLDAEAGLLRTDWGQEYERNSELAKRAGNGFGIDIAGMASNATVPVSQVMKILAQSGEMMTESGRVSGNGIPPSSDMGTELKLARTDPNHPKNAGFLRGDKDVMEWMARGNKIVADEKRRAGKL